MLYWITAHRLFNNSKLILQVTFYFLFNIGYMTIWLSNVYKMQVLFSHGLFCCPLPCFRRSIFILLQLIWNIPATNTIAIHVFPNVGFNILFNLFKGDIQLWGLYASLPLGKRPLTGEDMKDRATWSLSFSLIWKAGSEFSDEKASLRNR